MDGSVVLSGNTRLEVIDSPTVQSRLQKLITSYDRVLVVRWHERDDPSAPYMVEVRDEDDTILGVAVGPTADHALSDVLDSLLPE